MDRVVGNGKMHYLGRPAPGIIINLCEKMLLRFVFGHVMSVMTMDKQLGSLRGHGDVSGDRRSPVAT
jgi:hypothetical protein